MENETNVVPFKTLEQSVEDSIKITHRNLGLDHSANESLHTMGRQFAQPGMEYCGTIAIHLYKTSNTVASVSGDFGVSNITNITMKQPLAEIAVVTTLKHATEAIKKHFKPRT